MTPLLLSLALHTAHASGADREGDLLLVSRDTWLLLTPDRAGPRLRAAPVAEAGDHALSPAIVLHTRGDAQGGLLPVVVVPQDTPFDPTRGPATPDVMPDDWTHCYAQPPTLAQAGLALWVDESDIVPVLTRDVSLTLPDGDTIRLARGLAAIPQDDGRTRIEAMHVRAIVTLPDGVAGLRYHTDGPPAQRMLTATSANTTWVVQPTYSLFLDASRDRALPLGPAPTGGTAVTRLDDRCLSITPSTPIPGVPRADPRRLRGRTTWPIGAAAGTEIVRADTRARVGETARNLVLWSRRTCTWTDAEGLCCDPVSGLSIENLPGGLCFDADLPDHDAAMSLDAVAAQRAARLARITGQSSRLIPEVSIEDVTTRGVLGATDLAEALAPVVPDLARCYDRQLSMHPEIAGSVRLRFAVAPDAHARAFDVLDDDLRDEVILRCAERVLSLATIVAQMSQPTSVAELTLRFSTRTDER